MNKSQVSVALPTPPPASQTQSIDSSTPTLTKSKHRATQKVLSHNFSFFFFLFFFFFDLFSLYYSYVSAIVFCYWNKGTKTNQPIGSSGLTPCPILAARSLPPQRWGRVAQVPKITKPVLASRRRRSQRVAAIFWSGQTKPIPPIHIDLTKGDSTRCGPATRGAPATRGGPSLNRDVGTSGAASYATAKMKGKRAVASAEKTIEIVEAKMRKMKPDWKR
jgi:hypothetical protein